MDYNEKTQKKADSFIKTSYGSKAYWWGILLPIILSAVCWTSFFCLLSTFGEAGANYIDLAKSVAYFIGGIISTCTLCIGNMLFGLMYKDYADSTEKEK